MKERTLTLAAALLCSALAACGGPDLGTPESCAKSYQTAMHEQRLADQVARLDSMKWEIDCDEAQLPWFADKSAREKEIKKDRALYDFIIANKSALTKYVIEVVGVNDQKEGDKVVGKLVELRIKGKDIKPKNEDGTEFELKDEDKKRSFLCTQIEGKWKIKNK